MNVSSASSSSPASIPLSLQTTGLRGHIDQPVSAVGQRTEPRENFAPAVALRQQRIDLDEKTEKKLSRIKEVQVAFMAALNIANSIEEQYLLDPII